MTRQWPFIAVENIERQAVMADGAVRLVMTSVDRGAFVLDGIVASGNNGPGEPMVLFLARPETSRFDAALARL